MMLALSFGTFPVAHAQETAGQVHIVVGAAQLIDATGKSRPLERGEEIKQGDRIVTGEGALVQMKMTDGALLSVRTNTDVTVEKYRHDKNVADNSSMLLKLVRGALRSITGLIGGSNPNAYKIATPTATIGIRGTDHEPVFIPEPKPGETPLAPPGTYDKVNSGATTITTQIGTIDIKPGQVGFVPVAPGVVPKLLPAVPDFFKRLDPKTDPVDKPTRGGATGEGKVLPHRPLMRPTLDLGSRTAEKFDPGSAEKTISPTLSPMISPTQIEAAPTLTTSPKIEQSNTLLQPATTLIAPTTTIQPATTLITPSTTIQPTTVLTAPTTTIIQPTTPLIKPTTILQPTTPLIIPTTTIK